MKCVARGFDEPRCKEEGTIAVPTGYGRDDLMCDFHARAWAEGHLRTFQRLAAFYDSLEVSA